MVLWQIDVIKRVAYTGNPSGWYYWSSVYYLDRADYSSNNAAIIRTRNVDSFVTQANVTYVKYIVKSPPGRANVILTSVDGFNHGGQPTDPNGASLLNVSRLRTRFDDGTWSYRYAGRPMPIGWTDGIRLNATGRMWIGGYINAMATPGGFPRFRNQAGSPIADGIVPELLCMWQLRHGTKRRERVY